MMLREASDKTSKVMLAGLEQAVGGNLGYLCKEHNHSSIIWEMKKFQMSSFTGSSHWPREFFIARLTVLRVWLRQALARPSGS